MESVRDGGDGERRLAFVFPGQGSQWVGMADKLLQGCGVFAKSVEDCEDALAPFVDWSLRDVLSSVPGAPPLERVDVVQPTLFAVMVSLALQWRADGVEPQAVVGHSQGEIAAAYFAGALTLDDAARVVAQRSRIIAEDLAGRGTMISVGLGEGAVRKRLTSYGGQLSLAAINSPTQTVVAGELSATEDLRKACLSTGVWARRIPVDFPSHSQAVEGLRQRILKDLKSVQPHRSTIPMCSTVNAEFIDTCTLDAAYWYRSLRQPVKFSDSVETLLLAGITGFIEVSPHPVLTSSVEDIVDLMGMQERVITLGTLRREQGGALAQYASALAVARNAGL